MKTFLILIVFSLTISEIKSARWVKVWSDEFDGGTVGASWNFEIGNNNGWSNNELQYYTNSNHVVKDGLLTIEARKEPNSGFQYTSTRMTTQNKFSIAYGKFEIRAKLPFGQGVWPGFWLLGSNISKVGWPKCGEIDIMEFIGSDPTHIYGSVHGSWFDKTHGYNNADGFSNDFHTYAVNVQPDRVEYYVDGNLYGTDTAQDVSGQEWSFNNNPMFIIINFAVGGYWPGNPDASTQFPQQFVIDYVRVYEMDWSGEELKATVEPVNPFKEIQEIVINFLTFINFY